MNLELCIALEDLNNLEITAVDLSLAVVDGSPVSVARFFHLYRPPTNICFSFFTY